MAHEETNADLEQIKSDLAEKASEVVGQAMEFARERPHVAVGAALAIGWILGNGLPPRVIMGAARIGWKAMLGGALGGAGLMSILGGQDEGDASPRPSQGASSRSPRRAGSNAGEGHARSRSSATSGPGGGSAVKD